MSSRTVKRGVQRPAGGGVDGRAFGAVDVEMFTPDGGGGGGGGRRRGRWQTPAATPQKSGASSIEREVPHVHAQLRGATPGNFRPRMLFTGAPLSRVRWLRDSATAIVGSSGDGAGGSFVRAYSADDSYPTAAAESMDVGDDDTAASFAEPAARRPPMRLVAGAAHSGRVLGLDVLVNYDEHEADTAAAVAALVASSDGGVRLFDVRERGDGNGGAGALHTLLPATNVAESSESPLCWKESAVAAVSLRSSFAVVAGAEGSLVLLDVNAPSGGASVVVASSSAARRSVGGDVGGCRAAARLDGDGFVTCGLAGASVTLWDVRMELSVPTQRLRSAAPQLRGAAASPPPALLCVDVDAAQTHYVFAGGDDGAVRVWDRRRDDYALSCVRAHGGGVADVRVNASRFGTLLSCGDDGGVLAWDFAAAASRGIGSDETWRAEVSSADIQQLASMRTLPPTSVDAHPRSELVAYVTDSSTLTFTTLNAGR